LIWIWPFDTWEIPEGKSVVAEIYTALWMRRLEEMAETAMNMPHTRRLRGCNAPTAVGHWQYFSSPH
jgi:hypothetical protein